jgi:hypothetical protein
LAGTFESAAHDIQALTDIAALLILSEICGPALCGGSIARQVSKRVISLGKSGSSGADLARGFYSQDGVVKALRRHALALAAITRGRAEQSYLIY